MLLYGLFGSVLLGMIHRWFAPDTSHAVHMVRMQRNNSPYHQKLMPI